VEAKEQGREEVESEWRGGRQRTSFFASSSVILDLNSDSKTAMAAREPEPIVTYGSESVLP